jgi:hypothetical protein
MRAIAMNYSELETLDASAYLIPDTFRNAYDTLACNVAKREARYQEGIADGNSYSAFSSITNLSGMPVVRTVPRFPVMRELVIMPRLPIFTVVS